MSAGLVSRAVERLRSPSLVRGFQELCGVHLELVEDDHSASKGRPRTDSTVGTSPNTSPDEKTPPFPFPGHVLRFNPVVDAYFRCATEAGYEMFYITMFPLLHYNVDTVLFRQMIILWGLSMYVGQALKAVVCWKRPPTPPVFRLENNPILEAEYGFPSTHAIVSTTTPFHLFFASYQRYSYSFSVGFGIALLWSVSVCLSRLYLGVHSVMDIVGGVLISIVMLALSVSLLGPLDIYLLHSPLATPLSLAVVVLLLAIYPVDPHRWTMDRGDTAAILGVGLGMVVGSNFLGEVADDLLQPPLQLQWPVLTDVYLYIVRFVLGVLLLVSTRFVMKLICFRLLPALMPTGGVVEVGKRPWVELPYKVITYGAIGFNCAYTSIHLFRVFGICRY